MSKLINRLFAKGEPKKPSKRDKAIFELVRQTESMTNTDLAAWRAAWRAAVNVDRPNRLRLYDIYRDALIDLHLSGCIEQRTAHVMSRSFVLKNADGTDNDEATEILNVKWFKDFMRYALESIYWGHSLIELGPVVELADGRKAFASATLVSRKHVVPEHHRVIRNQMDDWKKGIDYHEEPYSSWLIEAGNKDDLGLLLKASSQTIPKRNAMAFWDTFAEIFGIPMRVARTTTRDESELDKLSNALDQMGSTASAVLPEGTDLQIVESSRGDAYNVYNQRIDRANSELSKLIIGQTMTIENGSSLSQSETHLKVFLNLIEKDCDMLRDLVNSQLLPLMVRHGFPVNGLQFDWDYSVDYTPEQQLAFETAIADRYEVESDYFADKYGMPVGPRRESGLPVMAKDQVKQFFF